MNVDLLVQNYMQKEKEISSIASQINASAKNTAIIFIDLIGSTSLKQKSRLENWLVYIYRFITIISRHVVETNGVIIKRIGDELMISFDNANDVELFLQRLYSDQQLITEFTFRTGVDYGIVHYFKFEELARDDPYGTIVDRCARIVGLCGEPIILCSSDYVQQTKNKDKYVYLGKFSLRGIGDPQDIYICTLNLTQNVSSYLAGLVEDLNSRAKNREGYRYVSRYFTPSNFVLLNNEKAKPFLIQELLRVPKLPYSLQNFIDIIKDLKDFELDGFTGYLVEWEGYWNSYTKIENYLYGFMRDKPGHSSKLVGLYFPSYMNEIISSITGSTKVRVRGILVDVKQLSLNFVDLTILQRTEQPAQTTESKQSCFRRIFGKL